MGPNQWSAAQRHVAYDEIWRHEESELWNWLEDRVAMDRVHASVAGGSEPRESKEMSKPKDMKDREMDEAIRVTEQRLKALKSKVEKDRAKKGTKSEKVK